MRTVCPFISATNIFCCEAASGRLGSNSRAENLLGSVIFGSFVILLIFSFISTGRGRKAEKAEIIIRFCGAETEEFCIIFICYDLYKPIAPGLVLGEAFQAPRIGHNSLLL
jgi:hypothetical protein